jgi:hypothetical protein
MSHKSHLTTGEIATLFGVPGWAARRAVDALGESIPRAGLYRLVPRDLLPRVEAKLREAGHMSKEPAHA